MLPAASIRTVAVSALPLLLSRRWKSDTTVVLSSLATGKERLNFLTMLLTCERLSVVIATMLAFFSSKYERVLSSSTS